MIICPFVDDRQALLVNYRYHSVQTCYLLLKDVEIPARQKCPLEFKNRVCLTSIFEILVSPNDTAPTPCNVCYFIKDPFLHLASVRVALTAGVKGRETFQTRNFQLGAETQSFCSGPTNGTEKLGKEEKYLSLTLELDPNSSRR